MASNSLLSLNFSPVSCKSPSAKLPFFFHSYLPSTYLQNSNKRREFPLPFVASIPYQPINVDYLEREFSGHGVTFEDVGDSCIAKMVLENGSTATLMLPSGLITSYKAHMWHGSTVELLQTSVSEGKDGSPVIQGGVSLAFRFGNDDEIPWSPSTWALHAVRGTPQDSIQVELISTDARNTVEVRHIMNLQEDALSSQIIVSNRKSSSIQLMGSVISHLTVSTPEATYAYGLEGSNFFSRPMFLSDFSIVPPDLAQESRYSYGNLMLKQQKVSKMRVFFPSWGDRNQENVETAKGKQNESGEEMESGEVIEGEETENYKNLTEQMSRIYTSAPRLFTIIDRGRRNSVVIGRDGFEELYMFSPGSSHESYGMYSYICVGQSALLKPVILSPGGAWMGMQHLHNPNL